MEAYDEWKHSLNNKQFLEVKQTCIFKSLEKVKEKSMRSDM